MSPIKRSLLIFLFVALRALAAEEGGEGGEKGKEVKKDEKSAAKEYVDKTTKMNALQVKMLDSDRDFAKLVEEKEHEHDQIRVQGILRQMVEVSSRRNKDGDEFNHLKQELLYQYPGKSAELNRMYETQTQKSLDDMQSAADLDDLLTRVKKVIERKFAPLMPPDEKKVIKAEPPPEEPKKLKLEK
jgi:hypothetical protein